MNFIRKKSLNLRNDKKNIRKSPSQCMVTQLKECILEIVKIDIVSITCHWSSHLS